MADIVQTVENHYFIFDSSVQYVLALYTVKDIAVNRTIYKYKMI